MVVVDNGGHLQSVFMGKTRTRPFSATTRQTMNVVRSSACDFHASSSTKPVTSATRSSYEATLAKGGGYSGGFGVARFCPRCPHCLKFAGFGHLGASGGNRAAASGGPASAHNNTKLAEQEAQRLEKEAQKVRDGLVTA